MSSWARDVIWWHVYPLGFVGAEREALPADAAPVPRLAHLEAWLDYLVDLGANGLALGPVFASETHGYDTVDHHRVDARLGREGDLEALIAACHARGVRVLLDGVFNHVGRGHPAFADVLAHGRASRYASWFRIDWDGEGPDGFAYETFEGHDHLVALDHDEPEVADHIVEVMAHWLERGADGWRLDAAYAVPQRFWREVTDRVRERHPDAWFVGEVIHAPYEPWLTEGGLDAVTQYELWKAVWSSLDDRNLFELAHALERHREVVAVAPPLTFLGNHDVTRIASQLAEPDHLEHTVVLLATLPGVPSVYAGDEQGFTGVKEEHARGDDAVRPAFPADPSGLADPGWPLYHRHQELLGLRRRHRWLVDGELAVLELANAAMAYAVAGDGERLVVLLNLDGEAVDFDEAAEAVAADVDVLAAADGVEEAQPWTLPPHGWSVLRVAT